MEDLGLIACYCDLYSYVFKATVWSLGHRTTNSQALPGMTQKIMRERRKILDKGISEFSYSTRRVVRPNFARYIKHIPATVLEIVL